MSGKACQGLVILGVEVICSLGDELASPPSHHLDFCAPTPSNPPIFNFSVPPSIASTPPRSHLAHTWHTSYTSQHNSFNTLIQALNNTTPPHSTIPHPQTRPPPPASCTRPHHKPPAILLALNSLAPIQP